ncbi:DUF2332 domain-containing protein [Calidifontibacter sp. DB0510]|uniref:DUF2332 domain-containing protein n=1 Tax=Metallococcus carri TaxID=1656884 RepID=A0A967AZU0_9MICO|nr:DUF2332 domain-containing protein [Metallococcus carri]NHN55447.1 DUF2332 domain-containing protein [Metallococcus carri]NOP38369.1 DUF2332 family protein [Calidifontibacter sp. DB2511S]
MSDRLDRVRRYFLEFAAGHDLPLYAAICRGAADDPDVLGLMSSAQPGQARPVLFLAAVHDLVLRNPDLPAAQWFPSVAATPPQGDPWATVRQTALDHADELRHTIATRTTQTNEVNRATYLAALLHAATCDRPDQPITLLEVGASAGLLLGVDRYRVRLSSGVAVGPEDSPVDCFGEDRSATTVSSLDFPPIVDRRGLDRDPISLDDVDRLAWLRACLWPEVPGRVERFDAAVELLRTDPPRVDRGDMVADLPDVIRDLADATTHLVVFSSWALTYVAPDQRAAVLTAIGAAPGAVSYVSAEPPSCVPGLPSDLPQGTAETVLGLHRWRDGSALTPVTLGTCQSHGAWLALD